jgi:hypothetical protein
LNGGPERRDALRGLRYPFENPIWSSYRDS